MNIVCIVQARMSSTRLPGKVMMPLVNHPVLMHVVKRLTYSKLIDKIVVATSIDQSDDVIAKFCDTNKIECSRGSLNDVLDRYYQSAKDYSADHIVRITSDCPLIDPIVVDKIISGYLEGNYDHFCLTGEFPDGLDCTIFSFKALEKTWKESTLKSEREHVCPYMKKNLEITSGGLSLFNGLSQERWTLDEEKDYEFLTRVFEALYKEDAIFFSEHVLEFLNNNISIRKINTGITRNEGYIMSLEND